MSTSKTSGARSRSTRRGGADTAVRNHGGTVAAERQRGDGSRRTPRNGRELYVVKIGGELLESDAPMQAMARLVARAARHARLVVVHGGGKEIDTALAQAGIPKRQVDGLRITDERTLHVVVSVLAGSINTRFVAAINAAGGRAVGVTGADAGVGWMKPARPHRATNGEVVDLGQVGEPSLRGEAPLLETLAAGAFTPVVACIGAAKDGRLFNVNADTLASSLAARTGASRLVFAGSTAGVLDTHGETIRQIDEARIGELLSAGTATAGMIAKLRAARHAFGAGVPDVVIADGRSRGFATLLRRAAPRAGAWTRVER